MSQIRDCDIVVTVTNVTNCHTLNMTGTHPVSVSVWNLDQNDSKSGGVATISRLLKMIGLFCKRAL